MKNETVEGREDRLYVSKLFDLQEWGNRHSLYLFAYSIHYKEDGREEATGYFFTDEEKIQTDTGCDLFIINFDTNDEGDGAGFITPRKNEAFKTTLDFAKAKDFKSAYIVPVDPAYSYLLANEMILPFENRPPELKREVKPCEDFDISQMKYLDIDEVTEKVFNYERSTGADRGTLATVANTAARYGAGDALKAGWGGLGASGMSPGQYNEFLRGLQRVMEDGISKGFVRSADQVATSFTMLAQLTGNNPLWQGENGARRLSEMNAGLESTTGLKSATDIRVFRAAQKIAKEEGLGDSYWEAMKIVEAGLGGKYGTRLLHETMKLNMAAEGGGVKDVGESARQQFGFNYTLADEFLKDWLPYQDMDSKAFESLWKSQKAKYENTPLPNANSPELEWTQLTAQTANIVVQTGQIKFDESLPMLLEGRKKAENELREAMAGSKPYQPTDTTDMTPQEALRASQADYAKALKKGTNEEFEEAARRAEKARMEALAPQRNIFNEIPNIQNGVSMTIPDFFRKGNRREDKTAENKMFNIFDTALRSGEEGQIQTAHDTFRRLQSVPKEVRERWDSTNAINPLADSNGMRELLVGINRLIEIEEKNGAMRFIIEP